MPIRKDLNALPDRRSEFPVMEAVFVIKSVTQKLSAKGVPQDEITLEVIAPDAIEFGGKTVGIAGRERKLYLTYSDAALPVAAELLKKLGLSGDQLVGDWPTQEEIAAGQVRIAGLQDHTKALEKHQFTAVIRPEPYIKTLTGKRGGPAVIDPATGQPVIDGYGIGELKSGDILSSAEPSNHVF